MNSSSKFYKIMINRRLRFVFVSLLLIIISGFLNVTLAQTFEEARDLAFSGKRIEARKVCRTILSQGFNSDVALLLGRTYAWDGEYDSARVVLTNVLVQKPGNMEAFDALADVEYWSENYLFAVEYCNKALEKDSASVDFILKKAKILNSFEKFEEAVNTLKAYYDDNPDNAEVLIKLKEYRLNLMKNIVSLSYTIDYFNKSFNRDPWQITYLSYSRKTKIGSVIARVNLADRFATKALQFEIDAYPKVSENDYFYLNYGFSKKSIFPKNRMGLEWYRNFPNAYEGSLGLRLLFFNNSNVDIYTATIGKYIGNYWISLRSFVTPGEEGTSVSGLIQVRRYFSDPENYIGMRIAYGVSPDDNRNYIDSKQKLTLNTRSFRLAYNHIINNVWIFKTGAVLGQEERQEGIYSGYYTFDISISRLF